MKIEEIEYCGDCLYIHYNMPGESVAEPMPHWACWHKEGIEEIGVIKKDTKGKLTPEDFVIPEKCPLRNNPIVFMIKEDDGVRDAELQRIFKLRYHREETVRQALIDNNYSGFLIEKRILATLKAAEYRRMAELAIKEDEFEKASLLMETAMAWEDQVGSMFDVWDMKKRKKTIASILEKDRKKKEDAVKKKNK